MKATHGIVGAALVVLTSTSAAAGPLLIHALSTSYTTTVSNRDRLDTGDFVDTTRTQHSTSPLSDRLIPTYCCDVTADVGLFTMDLFALAMHAEAAATSLLTFQPIAAGLGTLAIDLTAKMHSITFAQGVISLFDTTAQQSGKDRRGGKSLTSKQKSKEKQTAGGGKSPTSEPLLLWEYAWGREGVGTVPWDFALGFDPFRASWTIETLFDPDHTYALMMTGATQSRSDTEHLTMRVSNVETVPEPMSLLLFGTGGALLYLRRRVILHRKQLTFAVRGEVRETKGIVPAVPPVVAAPPANGR